MRRLDGRSFSTAAQVRQTLAVAARAWRDIAVTRAFLVILVGALVFVFAFGWDVGTEIFGTSTLAGHASHCRYGAEQLHSAP